MRGELSESNNAPVEQQSISQGDSGVSRGPSTGSADGVSNNWAQERNAELSAASNKLAENGTIGKLEIVDNANPMMGTKRDSTESFDPKSSSQDGSVFNRNQPYDFRTPPGSWQSKTPDNSNKYDLDKYQFKGDILPDTSPAVKNGRRK
ncbi:MAG: hypothetical protein IPP97_06990 [Candidatus Obscuribacter sp.]|nr:hypothetical protein [Candidatus Obscuribacter sp.]MBP6347992.1 hypothetical protein [Candidatus Obscuribacter sp.]MBP6591445.1 hypothetical protein [Candidatus Obscuribacter sp.]